MFYYPIDLVSMFTNVLTLQYFPYMIAENIGEFSYLDYLDVQ